MNHKWLLAVALVCAPPAFADPVKLLPSAMEMPDRIGPLVYNGQPSSWADPRLGMAYAFIGAGARLDVYVYDAGLKDIPQGPVSRHACEQFEQAKSEVARGGYQRVSLKSEQLARLGSNAEAPLAREAVFETVLRDVQNVSFVWLTAMGGNFVKLRFSINASLEHEIVNARRAVLDAIGTALGPHLAPSPPAAADAATAPGGGQGRQIRIAVNPGNTEEMTFGALYLTIVAAQAARNANALPPCGGPLRLMYNGELEVFRNVVRVAGSAGDASKFTKQVIEADKAGFLEEFVWVHRNQSFWGTAAPDGLQLDAFREWSQRKLEGLKVPEPGYVEVPEVRTLPTEPL